MFYFSICNLWMKYTSKKLTRKLISERKTNLAYLEDDLINIFRSRPKYFISGSNMIRKMFEKIKRGTSRRFWEKCKHFNWLSASATANCFACFDWISQILLFSSRGPAVENPGATWTDSAQIQIFFFFVASRFGSKREWITKGFNFHLSHYLPRPIQLLEYQILLDGGLIWYSREIGLCTPCTRAPPLQGGDPSRRGGLPALASAAARERKPPR